MDRRDIGCILAIASILIGSWLLYQWLAYEIPPWPVWMSVIAGLVGISWAFEQEDQ